MSDSEDEEEFNPSEWPLYAAGWNGRKQLGILPEEVLKRRKQWLRPFGAPIEDFSADSNEGRRLKNGDKAATFPVPISYFDSSFRPGSVACGENHSLVTDAATGILYSMGANDYGQCGDADDVSKNDRLVSVVDTNGIFVLLVAAGSTSSYFISGKRQLYSWGDNRQGQLGLGMETHENEEQKIEKQDRKNKRLEKKVVRVPQLIQSLQNWRIKQVAAGEAHVLALTMTGSLYTWGRNCSGQLGLGDTKTRWDPSLVVHMKGCRIVCVGAGGNHSACAGDTLLAHHLDAVANLPKAERAVFVWGKPMWEDYHNDDRNYTLPTVSLRKKQISHLALGEAHVLALESTTQQVFAWGDNTYGQLGVGDNYERLKALKIEGLSNIKKIAAGKRHSLAIQNSGMTYAWGRNLCGEVGVGDFDCRLQPEPILHLSQVNVCEADCSSICSLFGATVANEEESVCFGNEDFRYPLIDTDNDGLTAIRRGENDGYTYLALAGPAVDKGTYRWEVLLERSMSAEFDVGIGVASPGDCDQYIFDPEDQGNTWLYLQSGKKVNMGDAEEYGEPFFQQDSIGVELDMDIGTLRFYRRGKDLGVAYYITSTKDPLYLCVSLPGETDKVTLQILEDSDEGNRVSVDEGVISCYNEVGVTKTTGIEVFYECQPCKVRICRACARRCHRTHKAELIINHDPKFELCQCTYPGKSSVNICRSISRDAKTD